MKVRIFREVFVRRRLETSGRRRVERRGVVGESRDADGQRRYKGSLRDDDFLDRRFREAEEAERVFLRRDRGFVFRFFERDFPLFARRDSGFEVGEAFFFAREAVALAQKSGQLKLSGGKLFADEAQFEKRLARAERGALFDVNFRNDSRRRRRNADERTSRFVTNVTRERKRLAVLGRLQNKRSGVARGDSNVR